MAERKPSRPEALAPLLRPPSTRGPKLTFQAAEGALNRHQRSVALLVVILRFRLHAQHCYDYGYSQVGRIGGREILHPHVSTTGCANTWHRCQVMIASSYVVEPARKYEWRKGSKDGEIERIHIWTRKRRRLRALRKPK